MLHQILKGVALLSNLYHHFLMQQKLDLSGVFVLLLLTTCHIFFLLRSTNFNSTVSDSRENDLLEKLKQLSKDSKTNGFDTRRFTELLKEYTEGKIKYKFHYHLIHMYIIQQATHPAQTPWLQTNLSRSFTTSWQKTETMPSQLRHPLLLAWTRERRW